MADPQNPPSGVGDPLAPAPVPAPAPAPVAPWFDQHQSLKAHGEVLKKFDSAEKLGLAYVSLEKSMGSRIPMPGADAAPEVWDELWTKLGRPATAAEYGEYKPTEGIPWDKAGEQRFLATAHKAGLTKAQAGAVLDYYTREIQQSMQTTSAAFKKEHEEAVTALRDTWGANYDRNTSLAQQTVVTLGDKELVALLNETGMGNHPAMLKFLTRVGEGLVEDGVLKPDLVGKSTEQVQAEIATLMQSPAYAKREHADHDKTIARLSELYKVAYPSV